MNYNNTDNTRIIGRIDAQEHDIETLQERYPDWDSLSKQERLEATHSVSPTESWTTYNVTTERFHEYFVDNLDPQNTSTSANLTTAWVGLGTDAAGGTAATDTDLNTRAYEQEVTDVADNGNELVASSFLASDEGNGNTFDEIGLFTGDPLNLSQDEVFLINHATFNDVEKDNSKTLTFDVTLTFG